MPTGNFHPAIAAEIDKIQERGPYSPWAYVQYEVDGHNHIVQLGDGRGGYNVIADGEDMETIADELADAVNICSDSRHFDQHGKPHGKKHDVDEQTVAQAALHQLWTVDFDREIAELHWLMATYRKWGNKNVPAAVITPTEDGRDWHMVRPTLEGGAEIVPLRKGVMDDMPPPEPSTANKQDGFGWKSVAAESQGKKIRRLHHDQNGDRS